MRQWRCRRDDKTVLVTNTETCEAGPTQYVASAVACSRRERVAEERCTVVNRTKAEQERD